MYTYVTSIDLPIPQERIPDLLSRLLAGFADRKEDLPQALQAGSTEADQLRTLLKSKGYETSEEPTGKMHITDCFSEKLDQESDLVLTSLAGIVPAGSHLTFYGDNNSQWQIRYSDTQRWAVRGEVHFPDEGKAFPNTFLPGD